GPLLRRPFSRLISARSSAVRVIGVNHSWQDVDSRVSIRLALHLYHREIAPARPDIPRVARKALTWNHFCRRLVGLSRPPQELARPQVRPDLTIVRRRGKGTGVTDNRKPRGPRDIW